MPCGICVYAEHWKDEISPGLRELVVAAKQVQGVTHEPIQIILAAKDCSTLISQMEQLPVDEIYVTELERDGYFQDDALSLVLAEMLEKIKPSCVLIPASDVGRSLFPRVACRLQAGLTADCTELAVAKREDGSFYIRQIKPSFEENVKVSICCKEGRYPQMMTIREGIYEANLLPSGDKKPEVIWLKVQQDIPSGVEVLEILPETQAAGSLQKAEIVVVGGRGALENNNFELMTAFAEKIGAAVGGTRPLMDMGKVPFACQIGQTGCTVRPKICISFGVSGAIQHTEGIKNTKLFLAVNTAKDAPIFQAADYGALADMKPVLEELLALLERKG